MSLPLFRFWTPLDIHQDAASDLNVFNLYDIKAYTTISYYQILQHIVYLHWRLRLCSFEVVHVNKVSLRRGIYRSLMNRRMAYLYSLQCILAKST